MRGIGENKASMRCMRVRVIVSRISATVSESRSSAPSTRGSTSPSRRRRASSLRASTMSDMPAIIRSSSSTPSRTERLTARACWGVSATGVAAGAASSARAAIRRSSVVSSVERPASIASVSSPMRSTIARTALTNPVSGVR